MQRFKKDNMFIVRELKGFLKKFPNESDMNCINDLLESLAKRMDSELMDLDRKNGNKMLDMMQFIAEASGWSFEIIGLDTQKAENFDTFE